MHEESPVAIADNPQPIEAEKVNSTRKRERTLFEDTASTVLTFALFICLFIRLFRDTSFAFSFATDILGVITEATHLWLYTKVDGESLKSQWLTVLCLIFFVIGVVGGIITLLIPA